MARVAEGHLAAQRSIPRPYHYKQPLPYLFEYKSHFFVPENQSKNGGATYTRG